MQYDPKNYPKNIKDYKEVHGYGGIRIYRVSEQEGKEIAKEFPNSFRFNPPFRLPTENEQVFYMNVNHGEQHFIFSLPTQ
jgi:hypothetical protein